MLSFENENRTRRVVHTVFAHAADPNPAGHCPFKPVQASVAKEKKMVIALRQVSAYRLSNSLPSIHSWGQALAMHLMRLDCVFSLKQLHVA
mmetsp:Transcript_5647/g.15796  ORF Transcript_5647/g.15796 Transcript_5647/m.15796 type:complete len:91 (-) Transcript_5647:292-564(-)